MLLKVTTSEKRTSIGYEAAHIGFKFKLFVVISEILIKEYGDGSFI